MRKKLLKILRNAVLSILIVLLIINVSIRVLDSYKIEPILEIINVSENFTVCNNENDFLDSLQITHTSIKNFISTLKPGTSRSSEGESILISFYCNPIPPNSFNYPILNPIASRNEFIKRLLYVVAVPNITGLKKALLYGCNETLTYMYIENNKFKMLESYSGDTVRSYLIEEDEGNSVAQ
ncbi:MAG: hypothetical protein OCD01_04210 [Fibrobacterales bacterium]